LLVRFVGIGVAFFDDAVFRNRLVRPQQDFIPLSS